MELLANGSIIYRRLVSAIRRIIIMVGEQQKTQYTLVQELI